MSINSIRGTAAEAPVTMAIPGPPCRYGGNKKPAGNRGFSAYCGSRMAYAKPACFITSAA